MTGAELEVLHHAPAPTAR